MIRRTGRAVERKLLQPPTLTLSHTFKRASFTSPWTLSPYPVTARTMNCCSWSWGSMPTNLKTHSAATQTDR
jgi:hypothetical protein